MTAGDLWNMGNEDQFREWLTLAEKAREEVPILRGLTLREIIAAQRYEWLDARMIADD